MNDAPPADAALDFDRADMPAVGSMICAACKTPITATYFGVNGANVCSSCRDKLQAGREQGSFWLALGYGLVAAIGGALIYYGVAAITNTEFGLISIFVGLAIGRAVRKGAGLRSGKRFRALAVGLAYLSITATYVPMVLKNGAVHSVLAASMLAVLLPGFMIANVDNPLGLIILGIGVYQAWKRSAAPVLQIQGPFQVPTAPAPVPVALEPAAPAATTH